MKILICTNSCHIPQQYGGSEISIDELALALTEAGHEVRLIASLSSAGSLYIINRIKSLITQKRFPHDNFLKYKTYRGWNSDDSIFNGVQEVLQEYKPDLFLLQGKKVLSLALEISSLKIPMICSLVDLEKNNIDGMPVNRPDIKYRANSNFTAERIFNSLNIVCPVIPPLIRTDRYITNTSRKHVTFVNPHPFKGCEIVVQLAKLNPLIPFVFQEAWPLTDEYKSELLGKLKEIRNVEFRAPTSDMRTLYSTTKVLIMPSQYEEAWGRVANEAQLSGIPVIASNRGGIPQAVGDGGIIIPYNAKITQWNKALLELWNDEKIYEYYSKKSLARFSSGELSSNNLSNLWLKLINETISSRIY
jgi:glycosyltransferase involved in cell wall biosynthesis